MTLNLNIEHFLKNHWQKKPLLIRQAFPDFQSPISTEELAGLACEDFVESRIISEHNDFPKWKLENGPFNENRFSTLAENNWTLLIQGLNKILPEFDDLLHKFDFIPSWRVDDLMASYAAPGGSVGPHIDQYDVFLLQASGRRKWMINETPVEADNFEDGLALNIIKDFAAESEWILEAGDMLYLPPNVSHYGIGMEDCITFSIGFRAPSHAELLSAYVDEKITMLDDSIRYRDPDLSTNKNSGEITPTAIDNIQNILLSQFKDRSNLEDWFARFITEYHTDTEVLSECSLTLKQFDTKFKQKKQIRRAAAIRANYLVTHSGQLKLYVNGEQQIIEPGQKHLARLFCNQHIWAYADLDIQAIEYFSQLYNQGYLEYIDE